MFATIKLITQIAIHSILNKSKYGVNIKKEKSTVYWQILSEYGSFRVRYITNPVNWCSCGELKPCQFHRFPKNYPFGCRLNTTDQFHYFFIFIFRHISTQTLTFPNWNTRPSKPNRQINDCFIPKKKYKIIFSPNKWVIRVRPPSRQNPRNYIYITHRTDRKTNKSIRHMWLTYDTINYSYWIEINQTVNYFSPKYSVGAAHAKAPQRFRQHFWLRRQSLSVVHRSVQTHGPVGFTGQNPVFAIRENIYLILKNISKV